VQRSGLLDSIQARGLDKRLKDPSSYFIENSNKSLRPMVGQL
jgi:hypothetical protein